MAADRKGESWAILAASEMGKGVWLKQRLAETRPARLAIWDTNDEYQKAGRQVATLLHARQLTHQRSGAGLMRAQHLLRELIAQAPDYLAASTETSAEMSATGKSIGYNVSRFPEALIP